MGLCCSQSENVDIYYSRVNDGYEFNFSSYNRDISLNEWISGDIIDEKLLSAEPEIPFAEQTLIKGSRRKYNYRFTSSIDAIGVIMSSLHQKFYENDMKCTFIKIE